MHPLEPEHHIDGSRVNSSLEICGDGVNEDVYFCKKENQFVMLENAEDCECFKNDEK
ncbi:MAG: hypothetical protein SVV03_05330 [Candidatus Nanohaloarchaea archaeon]|nr:hypothetical protein [Candidatus Nanohaloarchaea archaeon]